MGFVYSPKLFADVNIASFLLVALSILLALIVLFSALYLRCQAATRHTVDRVSFRLILWSMIAEVVYNCFYLGLYGGTGLRSDQTCSFLLYVLFASMGVANWLCTCIAINLMMTIVFWVNPLQKRLERWYVTGSLVVGVGAPLVPAILGHFGADKIYFGTCYFKEVHNERRRMQLILDVYLWQGLSCIIATVATASVLMTLFRQKRETSRALLAGNPLNAEVIPTSNLRVLNDRFYAIAVRISWYPICLVIVNGSLTAADLYYSETGGVKSMGQCVLSIIYMIGFSGRGMVFALLGIFVDPCLRRGFRTLRLTIHTPRVGTQTARPTSFPARPTDASAYAPRLLSSPRRPPARGSMQWARAMSLRRKSLTPLSRRACQQPFPAQPHPIATSTV